jgi:glucuronoarabinoxylan endo-1,4-beta-xylanase
VSTRIGWLSWCLLPALLGVLGCDPSSRPESIDSQTNWLKACEIDSQCGSFTCVCGVCTTACSDNSTCANLDGAACVSADDEGAIAQCGGNHTMAAGLCMPRCDVAGCSDGKMCVAGVCTPVPTPSANVGIDTRTQHQTLTGFGASVAYDEGEITSHPEKAALYKTLFADLGLDVLRLRNRYGDTGDDDLTTATALLAAAATSLGRTPTVFMTSWSPPAALKASNAVECSGNPGKCTLAKDASGAYDYAGFATYWRSGLDAYAAAGVTPDFIGIQNNPDWFPTASEMGAACVFLPAEGSTMVTVDGVAVSVQYPGFAEAQAATLSALSGLASPPKILAPETADFTKLADYESALDPASLDALAHHLYGVDPQNVDLTGLAGLGDLATSVEKPVFQTEMQADGLGTALLIHYATAVEGASAYLQTTLTSSATGPTTNPDALVFLDATDFTVLDPYYAMQHFALHTDPGWTRVDATSSDADLLTSAWLAPDGSALTVILVNGGATDLDPKLDLTYAGNFAHSDITRTVFGGVERAADLGSLSAQAVLTVPSRSIVTVALSN